MNPGQHITQAFVYCVFPKVISCSGFTWSRANAYQFRRTHEKTFTVCFKLCWVNPNDFSERQWHWSPNAAQVEWWKCKTICWTTGWYIGVWPECVETARPLCCTGIPQRSWVMTQRCAWYSAILTTPRTPRKPPHPTLALVTDHPGSQERTIWPLHRGPSLWWRWRRDKREFKGIVGDKACGSASLDTWQMNVMNLT